MALKTYDELRESIKNFMGREDLDGMIPDFIRLAESALNNTPEFRLRRMVNSMAIDGGDDVVYLPEDYLGIKKLLTVDGHPLDQVAVEALSVVCEDKVYVEMGEWVKVYHNESDLILYYYAMLPSLSADREDNWLLKLSPNIYLYGSLLQATEYMKNDDRIPVWLNMYNAAVEGLVNSDNSDKWAGSIPQVRMVK